MTTEQMHVIAKITDARTFERQLEQTVEEAAEFIQAAQKIKRYPGNSLQMNHLVEETGDLLFAAVNVARKLGVDPEEALYRASDKFTERFSEMEKGALASGTPLSSLTPEQLDERWEAAKTVKNRPENEKFS